MSTNPQPYELGPTRGAIGFPWWEHRNLAQVARDEALIKLMSRRKPDDARHSMTAMMFAAHEGNIDTVMVLIEAGADVKTKNEDGWTARKFAESKGNTEIVTILKRVGAWE